jgi:vitamin B12 transporter
VFHTLLRFSFLLAIGIPAAAAQTATLTGSVSDSSGALISGALLRLHEIAGSALLTSTSDANGRFRFEDVAPGEYLLDAGSDGLVLAEPKKLTLRRGGAANIAVTLSVAAVKTKVSVTAASEPQSLDEISKALDIVNATDAEQRGIFSVSDALRFTPGLRVSTDGGPGAYTVIQTRGMRVQDTAALIDGFRFRDPTAVEGDASSYIGDLMLVDSSRIEVLRGSGSSLYGTNSMAGTLNIITDPGGGPIHGDIDLQGGGLGLFRGVANLAGGAWNNRLTYSAGMAHLNVSEGVDDVGAVTDWSGQGNLLYALTSKIRVGIDLFGNRGYLQENTSPVTTTTAPITGIIPAIPLAQSQIQLAQNNLPFNPGDATFIPSLGDPDAGHYAHFLDSLFRFEHEVNSRWSYRIGYSIVDTKRDDRDGPGGPYLPVFGYQPSFNTSTLNVGRIDTVQARVNYVGGEHQVLTAGYEFERELYTNLNTDQNPIVSERAYDRIDARQRSNAAFAQDELRFFGDRLNILLSGRFTQASLDLPVFTGAISPYPSAPEPPSAYTGDASLAYFLKGTSTKLRGHVGNSFRLPSLYERYGGYLFDGYDLALGDPRLAPERAVSVDAGIDQYLLHGHLKLTGTYFYSHLQQVIGFLNFPPGYVDPYGRSEGYYNTGGGVARGVELSGDFRPARKTAVFASYTYTNAKDLVSEFFASTAYAPLQVPRLMPNTVTIIATQQLAKHIDLGMDFWGGSDYLFPLYGYEPYPYRFAGPRQLGLDGGYTVSFDERRSARLYVRVSNALDQTYYEEGFRTPQRWAVGGIRFGF